MGWLFVSLCACLWSGSDSKWKEIILTGLFWRHSDSCVCIWSSGVWSIPSGVWRGVGQRPCSVFLLLRATQRRSCVWMPQMSCYSLDLKVHVPLPILRCVYLNALLNGSDSCWSGEHDEVCMPCVRVSTIFSYNLFSVFLQLSTHPNVTFLHWCMQYKQMRHVNCYYNVLWTVIHFKRWVSQPRCFHLLPLFCPGRLSINGFYSLNNKKKHWLQTMSLTISNESNSKNKIIGSVNFSIIGFEVSKERFSNGLSFFCRSHM